uniref:protein broad-minded isoform X2 n=1 Tax=Myxine glutinosa TaxID=7769 RepID=UPI00358E1EB6
MNSNPEEGIRVQRETMTDPGSLMPEVLIGPLKELIGGVQQDAGADSTHEDVRLYLLQNKKGDHVFHKYKFGRLVRSCLEEAVGGTAIQEICRTTAGSAMGSPGSANTLAQTVATKVRHSSEYVAFEKNLDKCVRAAAFSLTSESHRDMGGAGSSWTHPSTHIDCSFLSDSEDGEEQFAFLNLEELHQVAKDLEPKQPLMVRRKAFHALSTVMASDMSSGESWSFVRLALHSALSDPDSELREQGLHLHARIFTGASPIICKEIYISLALQLHNEACLLPRLSSPGGELNLTNPRLQFYLRKMRLLNEFQKHLPSFWLRAPAVLMEEVIEHTLELLCVSSASSDVGTIQPLLFLALLDSRAFWFQLWTHSFHSRQVLLGFLRTRFSSLVGSAVGHCLNYYKALQAGHRRRTRARDILSLRDQQLVLFTHSLSLLQSLLLYKHGRDMFPLPAVGRDVPMSMSDIVTLWVRILITASGSRETKMLGTQEFLFDVLRTLCERRTNGGASLLPAATLPILLSPLLMALRHPVEAWNFERLRYIGDLLSCLSDFTCGLSLLLHTKDGPCPAKVVVEFSMKALSAHRLFSRLPSFCTMSCTALLDPFLAMCGRLSGSDTGLKFLESQKYPACLSKTWREVSGWLERHLNSVPRDASWHKHLELISRMEEIILQSLLSLAGTPRGLLLLQQSGALNAAVCRTFSRHASALPQCESDWFSGNDIIARLSSCSPGIASLSKAGYVSSLVAELWMSLEFNMETTTQIPPRLPAMEPVHQCCLRPFLELVTLLSSSDVVVELLTGHNVPKRAHCARTDVPASLSDLIDCLVLLDSDEKLGALLGYESAHSLGLRLVSAAIFSLDSLLLLETEFSLSTIVLRIQAESMLQGYHSLTAGRTLDAPTLDRNRLLVQLGSLGGPGERHLPPRSLSIGDNLFPWPLFEAYPVPAAYAPIMDPCLLMQPECELLSFMQRMEKGKHNCIIQCKELFSKVLTESPSSLTPPVLMDFLEHLLPCLVEDPAQEVFRSPDYTVTHDQLTVTPLSPVQELGVKMVTRYGQRIGLLKNPVKAEHDLTLLHQRAHALLSLQRRPLGVDAQPTSDVIQYKHDWFVSTVFLMAGGNMDRSWHLLCALAPLLATALLWPFRLHASVHLPESVALSGLHPLLTCTGHLVESLVTSELPLLTSAFRMSGCSPAQLCQSWLYQCFWGWLDLAEVCRYIALCVALGADHQVYICIAALRHLQPHVLHHCHEQDLSPFLREEPLRGFRVAEQLDYLKRLHKVHHRSVLRDIYVMLGLKRFYSEDC